MKICPVGAEMFHADRRRDMTLLRAAFCNFANVPKNYDSSVTSAYTTVANGLFFFYLQ
jgi:hypothetical protein